MHGGGRHGVAVRFLAGFVGSSVSSVLTAPLDVLRSRYQSRAFREARAAQHSTLGTGVGSMLASIVRDEGPRALFRGLGVQLIGVGPSRALSIGAYSFFKAELTKLPGSSPDSPLVHLTAAGLSGMLASTVLNPLWVIKLRLQLQGRDNVRYTGTFSGLARIYREEGFRALYRGLGAAYLGVSESVIQFAVYEYLKLQAVHLKAAHLGFNAESNWFDHLIIGGASKLLASVATYPHEVVRTRLREQGIPGSRVQYKGIVDCFVQILRDEGRRGLYGGMAPHLLRVVPNSAIMFVVVEKVCSWFGYAGL